MKKLLKQYEADFMQNKGQGCLTAKTVYTYSKGKPVCFCAPHAVHSFVHKQERSRDIGTGAIVQYLGKQQTFSTIVRNKFVPCKEMISDFILTKKVSASFFLDIHGMRAHKDFDLAIGTGYFSKKKYNAILTQTKKLCRKYKIRYRVNLPQYMGKIGLTGRLQKTTGKANVLQLEFAPEFRDITGQIIQDKTIPFLIELGESIKRKEHVKTTA